MKRLLTYLFLGIFSVLMISCGGVLFVNPIAPPTTGQKDTRLEGLWTVRDEPSKVFIHIGQSDANRLKAVSIEHKENGALDIGYFSIYPSTINDQNFLNLQFREPDGKTIKDFNHYVILKYQFKSPDTLILFFINPDIIEKAVETKKLKGILSKKSRVPSIKDDNQKGVVPVNNYIEILDSSANINDFIKNYIKDDLFEETLTLKRVKL